MLALKPILGAVMMALTALGATLENWRRRPTSDEQAAGQSWLLAMGAAFLVFMALLAAAQARDVDDRYAQSPLKPWFDQLRSGKGPCCSDADGSAVSDVDWDVKGGHYRVRIDGAWLEVPDEAVITEPNRIGRTMVWPIKGYLGTSIRCFMPGSMS